MKKALRLVLDEKDLLELYRILTDGDEAAALDFLKRHATGRARALLEGS